MSLPRRTLATLALSLACLAPASGIASAVHVTSNPPIVSDDDPRFDCRTMGNLVCGPGALLPDGTPATAGEYDHGQLVTPW